MTTTTEIPGRSAGALDDRALVRLARLDEAARERACLELYDRHKDEVFSFLVRFLGADNELAEDVSQEAFLRVFRALERFDVERDFRPWLHQIVRNTALDALRARRKERMVFSDLSAAHVADGRPGVLPEVSRREEMVNARAAFDALPDETRALLFQRHGLGLKLEELAAAWSCTKRTVRNRLHAAASELAELLRSGTTRSSGGAEDDLREKENP